MQQPQTIPCFILQECQHFVGIDLDPTAHTLAEQKLQHYKKLAATQISLLQGNFGYSP